MKRWILMTAALVATLTVSAQHVTPLNVKLTDFNLEAIRAEMDSDKAAYYVQLKHIELDLKGDAESVKQAYKQLNEEKSYAACIGDYVKFASKLLKTYEKSCNAEISDLVDMQSTIDKQTAKVKKLTLVTHDSKPKFIAHMAEERAQVSLQKEELQKKLIMISKQQAQINKVQDGLNLFLAEINNKENDLKLKEATLKANQDALKAEMKTVKTAR